MQPIPLHAPRRRSAAAAAVPPAPLGRLDIVTTAQLRDLRDRAAAEGAMRLRCMVAPVDQTTALCRVLGRYKMYVDLRDTGFVPHLIFDGFWEYWLTDFMWRNLRPGQVAVDVGANHGYYTLLLSDLVGAQGRVHAVEPNPRLMALLRQTVALNGFWHVAQLHAAAVGDRDGTTLPLVVPRHDPKNAYVVQPGHPAPPAPDAEGFDRHEVPLVTLDAAIPGRADFVKIDVEGAEEMAWRGMQQLIARSPGIRILLEFNPRRCLDPRGTLADMAKRFPLREVGFDSVAVPCTPDQVLARAEDTILYLSDADAG